jgi:hypothetical protein
VVIPAALRTTTAVAITCQSILLTHHSIVRIPVTALPARHDHHCAT